MLVWFNFNRHYFAEKIAAHPAKVPFLFNNDRNGSGMPTTEDPTKKKKKDSTHYTSYNIVQYSYTSAKKRNFINFICPSIVIFFQHLSHRSHIIVTLYLTVMWLKSKIFYCTFSCLLSTFLIIRFPQLMLWDIIMGFYIYKRLICCSMCSKYFLNLQFFIFCYFFFLMINNFL